MSFRLKTILSIAFIESILLIILTLSVISFLNDSNEKQLQQRAESTALLFEMSVKNAVLSNDLATLDSFIKEILKAPDLRYARISNDNYVLAEGGEVALLQRQRMADKTLATVNDGIFDTRIEITEAGKVYGIIELGLSTKALQSTLVEARSWTIAIASLEVFLVALLSFILGTYLTRQLQQLKLATEKISRYGPGVQIPVLGSDEIAEVAHAFNRMSSSLAKNYQQLSNSIEKNKEMTAIANSNQAKNEAILTASLDALITINDSGEVVDYNKVAASTFGWQYDEIIGQDLAEFIIPSAQRQAHKQGMQRYLKTKNGPVLNQRLQLTAQHKSGHSFPIEINIAPIVTQQGTLFTAFIRDISAHLQAENELRLAAQTFESSEAIFICDAQATIIRTNQAFSRITGYDNSDVIGKNPRILSSGQHPEEYYQAMWLSLTRTGKWSGEIYNKRKNGEIYPEYLNISSIKNEAGEISHYIAHFMDISEQKENEQNLRQARLEAELSNESKSRFLASMSHEIRTPMNAVLGILGLLKDTQLTQRQLELVKTGRDSGELLLTIINDILDFTKMDIDKLILEKSTFDLHQLLASSNALLSDMADKKSLTLSLTKSQDLPQFVKGDSGRIRQILINLINNAIKFTAHGQIKVSASVDFKDQETLIIRCSVQDSGIGIAERYLDTLFDEFTMVDQTHARKYEGTGLGLAICKRLVELMQGTLEVHSKLGEGSTFTFTLHLQTADEDQCKPELSREQIQQQPLANTRILLAEDNPANQMVIKSILEFAKLQVDVVSNGYEAIEALRNLPYDIVLMDISMPEMDGMSATREIRKLSSSASAIPIIALTAHTLSGDKERFIAAGMNDYLSKPIDRAATLNCIARWTAGAKQPIAADLLAPDNGAISAQANAENVLLDYDYVDEQVLQALVRDTCAEIVPELITLYIEDSRSRIAIINEAIIQGDFNCLEFETHTIGSSAIAHGNAKLHALSRSIEQLCQKNEHAQAFEQAQQISVIANESFRQLAQRAEQGFE
ncbi:MAG: PAS domain S-box-containing protein [Psychromonas sp.]|jgi:PAS domain S-box-containing protein|uniref:PAS domain S-box protein n=1 Tax=Psychromonas sp. TaxID=1884585 RepID=UPI0039E6D69D